MKIDILAIVAHPDDAELSLCGILMRHKDLGKSIGVIDLTEGELGTNGTVETRYKEATLSSHILGLDMRKNLKMRDGFFENNRAHQERIIKELRLYQPDIVLTNAPRDRHPDHGRASILVRDACFLSGLSKIETSFENQKQSAHRPKKLYYGIQDYRLVPDVIVDISPYWERKKAAILAFSTQFHNPNSDSQKQTYISSPHFTQSVEARGKDLGHSIGVQYGEGLIKDAYIGVSNLYDLS